MLSTGITTSTSSLKADDVNATIADADYVVMVVDNAHDGGGEGHDRYTISLSEDQVSAFHYWLHGDGMAASRRESPFAVLAFS